MRNKLLAIVLGISFSLVSQVSEACDCLYWGKFADYVADGKAVRAQIMSYGERLPHSESVYDTMTVKVIEVVKGEFSPKTIIFWGDPGHLCRDYVDSKKFKIGSEFIFSISGDEENQVLGGCGESSVLMKNDKIYGEDWIDYKPVPYEMDYNNFLKVINAPRDTPAAKKEILSSSR